MLSELLSASALPAGMLFVVVTTITPGPNNTMLLASGVNFGFRRTVPHILGISAGVVVLMLSVGFGLGEVFRYVIRDTTGRLSPMDLRTVQDWIVRRGLLGTPGIAEVNSLGGFVRQYHVLVDPDALVSYNLTLREVFDAVARGSGNAGAGYIESGPEQYSVRSVGLATGIPDLERTVVRTSATGRYRPP